MTAFPKREIVRDRDYLDFLRTQRCILTGLLGNDHEAVDPCHIGQFGMSAKSSDDEALPVLHSLHKDGHDNGEISMFREKAPDWLLRDALRAYARELYRQWKRA